MVEIVELDLREKLPRFGPFYIVRGEWWKESPRMVLLRFELMGKMVETGVRLDLDKKAILDEVTDDVNLNSYLKDNVLQIWSEVVNHEALRIQR